MKCATSAICWLFLLASIATAQPPAGGSPVILEPRNGETVSSPVTIRIGTSEGGVTMADRSTNRQGAQLNIVIDAPLPEAGKMIPMDTHHIHLTHGESQKTISLSAGKHTIQLIEGSMSHIAAVDAPHSDPVTFSVK